MFKKILVLGDIVGRPGRKIIQQLLADFRIENNIDFVIANGENIAAGSGITPKLLKGILTAGVDVVTTGDHVYKNKDVMSCIDNDNLLRPLNYVEEAAGRGCGIYKFADQTDIAVINLSGRVFMDPCECPFNAAAKILEEIKNRTNIIIIDMHAEATSEKVAMGWYLDGRVSAVLGTHTHIQTADERILPGGTAYITDLGMTGPYESVLGRKTENVLHKFVTNMPSRFDVAADDVRLCGAVIEVDDSNGHARSIERVSLSAEVM
ncbi:MAG: TIGR00282 family metallophosphoesterase [Planctomycetota bacterium]